jgi:hypothetical protein
MDKKIDVINQEDDNIKYKNDYMKQFINDEKENVEWEIEPIENKKNVINISKIKKRT